MSKGDLARLLFVIALVGCQAERPQPQPNELQPPESWVRPETSPVYWTVWADVRDFVGEERWAELDTAWMSERARSDLATVTPEDDYDDEFLLSGLWRLGYLREEVIAALAVREPDPIWPLATIDRQICTAWRPRVARWIRAQPEREYGVALANKLEETWRQAVSERDLQRAARVVETRETWLGKGSAEELKPAVEQLVRKALDDYRKLVEKDWRDGRLPSGLLRLMERFGVPEGVDLEPVVDAARHYTREMMDESIPLPHPYDLELAVLRVERLGEG